MIQVNQSPTGVKIFRGGSDETKPGAERGIKPGSTFYEWDTASGYMFDGEEWLLQTSGGGGGGKEAYAIGFNFGGAVELQSDYIGKAYTPGSGAIEPSDMVYTVSKGDALYLLWWELAESDVITFKFLNDSLEAQDLLVLPASDFTLDTDGETYYTQITIPSVDLNGDDWGGVGYITVIAPSN